MITRVSEVNTASKAPQSKPRQPFWDNARWIAMALVVIGHIVQPMALHENNALVVYLLIYAFHMPLFALVSGYFTTAEPGARKYLAVISDLLVPYAVFSTIWAIAKWAYGGFSSFTLDYSTASWTLWFLLALAFFRIALPVIAMLRYPLLLTVVFALVVGFWSDVDQTFSLARTLQMLPFFVLGWKLKQTSIIPNWLERERVGGIRAIAVSIFGLAIVALIVFDEFWRTMRLRHWLFMDRTYDDLETTGAWFDPVIRLAIMLVTALLIAAALALIPRRKTFFSEWGSATMTIYLLHTFVLYVPRQNGLIEDGATSWWWLPILVVIGFAITVVLSLPIVRTLTDWIVAPKTPWLYVRSNQSEK
ncbi:acyltransferase family protein [Humidisolicoccus flavus]|uniref:acyltransferase family protein n=1 Tax=Humidisolicoccus flavus TaxID=3111414 RepID=UPI00324AF6D6